MEESVCGFFMALLTQLGVFGNWLFYKHDAPNGAHPAPCGLFNKARWPLGSGEKIRECLQ
jgi:hypothetical protein